MFSFLIAVPLWVKILSGISSWIAALTLLRAILRSPPQSVRHLVAVMFDMMIAVTIWHRPDITISTECGLAAIDGKLWGKWMCKFLGWLDTNHCPTAIQADIDRAKNVIAYLTPYLNK